MALSLPSLKAIKIVMRVCVCIAVSNPSFPVTVTWQCWGVNSPGNPPLAATLAAAARGLHAILTPSLAFLSEHANKVTGYNFMLFFNQFIMLFFNQFIMLFFNQFIAYKLDACGDFYNLLFKL